MKPLFVKLSTSSAEVKWAYNCSQNSNFNFLHILQYGVDEDCTVLEQPYLFADLIKQKTSIFRRSNNFSSSNPVRIILNVREHCVESAEFLVVLSSGVYSYRWCV
jgi:hypothetical protein